MKLDRNINTDGRGKYAVVNLRKLATFEAQKNYSHTSSVEALHMAGIVDYGDDPTSDFFLIRLKDAYAAPALAAYAMAAYPDDQEYAMEVLNLAKRAAEHPSKRKPD